MKTKIQITVGVGYRADGSTIPLHERIKKLGQVQDHLIDVYGGFTRLDTTGGYLPVTETEAIIEPGVIFVVLAEPREGEEISARILAGFMRNLFAQQSVILEVSRVNAEFI